MARRRVLRHLPHPASAISQRRLWRHDHHIREGATRRRSKSCCDAAFEDLRISDDAGVSVDAWFVPGTLPSAVLLIPSSGASKRAMLPYLKFLHAAGLAVMLIDNSDFARDRAGWGWNERGIVRSAAETLRQKGYANLAALGVSEGAATALMVQGENPDSLQSDHRRQPIRLARRDVAAQSLTRGAQSGIPANRNVGTRARARPFGG